MLRLPWCLFATILLLGSCATSGPPAGGNSGSMPVAHGATDAPRAGDVIRLQIWREPDLSGDFPIDETGVVVFPRIGPLQVTSESPESLKAKLIGAYKPLLTHSSINVTLLRRVQVLGAVRNPGLYPLDPTMTVGDALAVAGGTTTQGNPDKLELIRRGRKLAVDLSQDTRIADSPIRSGDQLFIPERSWISRNPGVVGASIAAGVSLIVALFISSR